MYSVEFGFKQLYDYLLLSSRGKCPSFELYSDFADIFGDVSVVFFEIKQGVDVDAKHFVGFVGG